jgi:succinate-semialdehyde dehydrogenase/glutarate-semialdehyde dehydrogenase
MRFLHSRAYIDGAWSEADNGKSFAVVDPATGKELTRVPDLGVAETERAIQAAEKAQPGWAVLTAKARADILLRWHDLMLANADDLGALMSAEQGKPLSEAKGEVAYAASFLRWFAEEARRTYGEVIPSHKAGAHILTLRQPVGVIAAVTPWNFPYAMITRKVGPALAAGCTALVKPAEDTPLSALALADLAGQAGVPKGVLNVLTGDAATIVGAMMRSPVVRKISFTGSTEVGRLLMRQAADTVKKVSLELGGNAPYIVFDDANLEAAVAGCMISKFRNAGQTCVCANRIYVQAGIYDAFAKRLSEIVAKLKVGAATVAGAEQGPLINQDAVVKIEAHITDALSGGAKLSTGGKRHSLGGTFFEPTVLTGVTQAMLMSREETFGPVAGLIRFDTEAEALQLANDSEFGLAGYVYTRDLGRAFRMAERLEVGMVGVNEGLISTCEAPFGGVKQSGLGREGSRLGMEEYLEVKYVLMGGLGV